MKAAMLILLLGSASFGQTAAIGKPTSASLRIELRTSPAQVRMSDDVALSVFFYSPNKQVTIWNALAWGVTAGLYLTVFDSSGRQVRNNFAPFFHPVPPDITGKDALITIGGRVFAGFDSKIPIKTLVLRPGRYTLRCSYRAPLNRDYFQGHTIWGEEDGSVEADPVSINVTE